MKCEYRRDDQHRRVGSGEVGRRGYEAEAEEQGDQGRAAGEQGGDENPYVPVCGELLGD